MGEHEFVDFTPMNSEVLYGKCIYCGKLDIYAKEKEDCPENKSFNNSYINPYTKSEKENDNE